MKPRFPHDDICLLRDERGITLVEVLVSAVVMVVLITSIYIGIMYAQRETLQNYRHRAATLIAAGELERQYHYSINHVIQIPPQFDLFQGKPIDLVPLDNRRMLEARLSVESRMVPIVEHNISYEVYELRSIVEWTDPESRKPMRVVLHEDFYKR